MSQQDLQIPAFINRKQQQQSIAHSSNSSSEEKYTPKGLNDHKVQERDDYTILVRDGRDNEYLIKRAQKHYQWENEGTIHYLNTEQSENKDRQQLILNNQRENKNFSSMCDTSACTVIGKVDKIAQGKEAHHLVSSNTIKMMNDKEKFMLAKMNNNVELLLELIQSNDQTGSNMMTHSSQGLQRTSYNQSNSNSRGNNYQSYAATKANNINPRITYLSGENSISFATFNELRSDLKKEWMLTESLISHCALNQLSYILLQMGKEMKKHVFYSTDLQQEKIQDLLNLRNHILDAFENGKTLERRIQRYMLMGDECGIQAALYILLIISNFESKSISNHKKRLNKSPPQKRRKSSVTKLDSSPHIKFAKSGSPSPTLMSQTPSPKQGKNTCSHKNIQNLPSKFKSEWIRQQKKGIIVDAIDHVLSDKTFTKNTVRVAILLLGNLHKLSNVAYYAKTKSTYCKLLNFFEQEREQMCNSELEELEKVLQKLYSQTEVDLMIKKKKNMKRVASSKNFSSYMGTSSPMVHCGKKHLIMKESSDECMEDCQKLFQIHQKQIQESNKNQDRYFDEVLKDMSRKQTGSAGAESRKLYQHTQENQQATHTALHLRETPKKKIPKNSAKTQQHTKFQRISTTGQQKQVLDSQQVGTFDSKMCTSIDKVFLEMKENDILKEQSYFLQSDASEVRQLSSRAPPTPQKEPLEQETISVKNALKDIIGSPPSNNNSRRNQSILIQSMNRRSNVPARSSSCLGCFKRDDYGDYNKGSTYVDQYKFISTDHSINSDYFRYCTHTSIESPCVECKKSHKESAGYLARSQLKKKKKHQKKCAIF